MAAVWMRARAELRARRRQILGLALLLGVLGGIVFGAAAGARRTASAYERYLERVSAPTMRVFEGGYPGVGFFYELDLDEVAMFPEVAGSEVVEVYPVRTTFEGGLTTGAVDVALEAGSVPVDERGVGRVTLVEGRFPRAHDEVVMGFTSAKLLGVEIGEGVTFEFLDREIAVEDFLLAAQAEPSGALDATIVGFAATPGAFAADLSYVQLWGTPGLMRAVPERSASFPVLATRLTSADASIDGFDERLSSLSGGAHFAPRQEEATRLVQRSLDVQALVLGLFGLVTAVALGIVAVQSMTRMVQHGREDVRTLTALGMDRGQRVLVQLLQAGLVGAAAAGIAVGIGILLGPLMMIGEAAVMDDGGPWADGGVLAVGAVGLIVVATAGTIPAAARSAQGPEVVAGPSGRRRPSWFVSALARGGATPAAVAGARLAVERGRGRTASPIWTTVISSAVGIAVLLAALLFGEGMRHLLRTPALHGVFEDTVIGFSASPDLEETVVPVLDGADHLVAGYGAGTVPPFSGSFRGPEEAQVTTPMLALDLTGDISPRVLDGEWPDARNELALGATTMRALGARIGERIDLLPLERGGEAVSMRVVGTIVMPSFFGDYLSEPALGVGAGMTFDTARSIFGPELPMNIFPVKLLEGADEGELLSAIPEELRSSENILRINPPDLEALARLTGAPTVVAGMLVLLAGATLAHGVLAAVKRRRRDLATLKAIGFSRSDVRRTVAWQASILMILSVALALPLGVLGGRWAWLAFTRRLGVAFAYPVPILLVLAVVPVAVIAGNIVALGPARTAARTRPAEVLRSE